MPSAALLGTEKVVDLLQGDRFAAGLAAAADASGANLDLLDPPQITKQNVKAEIAERIGGQKRPVLAVHCEKVQNRLQEKFRSFSGSLDMAIEVRVSQDRLEATTPLLHLYVDAITQALDVSRGDWGDGFYFAGPYEASLQAIKQGGRGFVQEATLRFSLGLSR